ncbi:unnamed protein product [Rhizoctonia solani]|uniref:Zn(2)-C6 fungal-type domain-containing protein n=1 Tax=Rhizoctonia solani TaxID=456999 RepID=A0A8H3CWX4_9AGAM|nr:unnamed protein product [Rhizoctonia solani]
MPSSAITRSPNGCLTCKNRKKKCDETRPICTRCRDGDFECLGYDYLDIPKGPLKRRKKTSVTSEQALSLSSPPTDGSSVASSFCHLAEGPHHSSITPPIQLISMVRTPKENPLDPDQIIKMSFFYLEQLPPSVQPFQSFPFPIVDAVSSRVKSSSIRLKSMYIGARITKARIDGASLSIGVRLIQDFQRQITNTTLGPDTDTATVAAHLDSMIGLALVSMQIVNTLTGHLLLRRSIPLFLALTAKFQELWANDSSISFRHALAHSQSEIPHFVFLDTVASLVFGIAPLIHYDVTFYPKVQSLRRSHIEWAHGCSPIVVLLLATVNSWRAARFIDPTHPIPTLGEQQIFKAYLQEWNPTIGYGDQPAVVMGRLAVQECWKHAVLIYMYMGMCEVDSADPRVEASVRQVAQLAATIEDGHPLETHITIPCVIAAAAARREKHRAILRKKIVASKDGQVCLIRGADFVLVLDHLWHGVAAGGFPTTWQGYVESRFTVMPVGL